MPSTVTRRQFRGAPIEYDLLEGHLDEHFPGFGEGRKLWWGLAVKVVSNSLSVNTNLYGVDWRVELHLPKSLKVPKASRRTTARTRWQVVKDSCALLAVQTEASEINPARDEGRLAVRRLAALIRREIPALLLTDTLWEGAIVGTARGTIKMMLAQPEIENVHPMPESGVHDIGMKLLPVEFTKLPDNLGKALEWLALARSASVRIEKFSHLWLSVVTLVNFMPSKLGQKRRIQAYVATMSDILRSYEREALTERLENAYDVRNELWHEAKDTRVTPDLLASLENDAFSLVDFEFIKLGKPLPR